MNQNTRAREICLSGLKSAILRMGFWRVGAIILGLAAFGGSASGQTVWMSAADGAWSNALAWTAGVPNFNQAFITNTAGAYTVSVGTDVAGTFSDLTLANAGVNTARLEIAGGSLLGSNGVINIKAGSALVLKTGGSFKYASTNRASDFATVTGGVLRIEDGYFQIGDSNKATRTESRYLTVLPNGLLEMTNGIANFYGANASGLNVNGGLFHMSGGSLTLANTNDAGDGSCASFRLVNAGTVRLDGAARLVTSNAFYLDSSANTTSRLEIAGDNASFTFISVLTTGRPFMNANGYTAIDVRKGRLIVGTNTDSIEANFYPNASGGTVAVNVWDGGYAAFKQIVMARNKNSGMAQVNVYGGTFAMPGGGCASVARDSNKSGAPIAQVNVTNGVFDMTDTAKTWINGGAPALAVGWNYAGNGLAPWGEINLSGGAISNAGGCALGLNKFTRGDLNQSGGIFRQGFGNANLATNNAAGQFVVGFSSGTGNCTISNGLFEAVRDVYVGGVDALARWAMTKIYAAPTYGNTNVAPGSVGTFSLAGGSVVISNTVAGKIGTLHVGDYGTGTVSVAASGSLYAQAVELHATPDGSRASTLRFTFGTQGVGSFACGSLTIGSGAKLVVNANSYTGSVPAFCLMSFGSKTGDFNAGDVTITGTRKWQLRTTATGIWLRRDTPALMMVK